MDRQIFHLECDKDHAALCPALIQLKKPREHKSCIYLKKRTNDKSENLAACPNLILREKLSCLFKVHNNMSGLIPSSLASPPSTGHPEGISTDTITGDFLPAISPLCKLTGLYIRLPNGSLGAPDRFNLAVERRSTISERHKRKIKRLS